VYRINSDRYVEAPVYLTINDQIGGRPPKNSIGGDPGESPVTVSGGTISFQAPAAFERVFNLQFEFDEGGFRAIGPGVFVDHWEKTN
jgi:hypothetical protein